MEKFVFLLFVIYYRKYCLTFVTLLSLDYTHCRQIIYFLFIQLSVQIDHCKFVVYFLVKKKRTKGKKSQNSDRTWICVSDMKILIEHPLMCAFQYHIAYNIAWSYIWELSCLDYGCVNGYFNASLNFFISSSSTKTSNKLCEGNVNSLNILFLKLYRRFSQS